MKVFQFSSSIIVIVIVTISMLIEKSEGSDIDGESQLIFHQGHTSEKPETDFSIISHVKDFLYQNPNRTTGLDLLVANIMRGRDHGIPGYVNYLDYCFGYKVNDWPDLYKYIPRTQVYNLQRKYRNVYDIDLPIGVVFEVPVPGNAMGPTFSCINGIQEYLSKLES